MDLEPEISDLESMTRITCQLAFHVGQQVGGDLKAKGDLIFAARTLGEMVEQFQRQWYDRLEKSSGTADTDEDAGRDA